MSKTNMLIALDLETTGTDVQTCEVAQVACVLQPVKVTESDMLACAGEMVVHTTLCRVDHMPEGATRVHGLTAEDTAEHMRFAVLVDTLARNLEASGVTIHTALKPDIAPSR